MLNLNINVNVINNGRLVMQNEPLANFFEVNKDGDTSDLINLAYHCYPLVSGESQYVTWDEIHSGKWSVEVVRNQNMNNDRLKTLLKGAIEIILLEVYGGENRQYVGDNLGMTNAEMDEIGVHDERD